jgi:hypothetical protein
VRGQYFSWALLACLLVPAGAFAQSKVIVQSKITPAKVMVGQQAQLLVDVYFLGTMTHPPSVDMPDIDGAQLFRFESQGIYISTTIGGNNYTGKEFEFDIYPRRSGNFQIPPATITLLDANGNPAGNMNGTAQTLIAQTPPGFSASTPIIASPNVTMGEKFTPSTPKLAVGDSVTRIITRHADAVPALSFSDISQPAIPGAQIYQAAPDIEDLIDHGDVTGKRVDKTTFVLERAGTFAIPKYTQTWWNTDMNQAETIEVPGFSATILPSAASSNATILPAAAYLRCNTRDCRRRPPAPEAPGGTTSQIHISAHGAADAQQRLPAGRRGQRL